MRSSSNRPLRALVVAATVVPVALFIALPLALLFARSVSAGPGAYAEVLAPGARRALWNTLVVGSGSALIALLAGAPLAAALSRLRLRGARALGVILVLPLAAPPYVWAMAWIALAAPRAGWINRLAARPLVDVYGEAGIVWVMGLALYPLVLLPTRAALESADASLEEAARISGAGPLRAFLTGSLPVAWPAAAFGTLLAFLGAISAFGVPYLLGISTSHPVLVVTTRIYQAYSLGSEADKRSAIALSAVLLLIAAVASWIASRLAKTRAVQAGKGRRAAPLDAPRAELAASALAWLFAAVAVLLPAGATVLAALTRRFGDPPGPGNLTIAQFGTVLGRSGVELALLHSGVLALFSASAIVALGISLAWMKLRLSRRSAAVSWIAEAPYAIPGSVLAIALLLAFSQTVRVIFLGRLTLVFEVMGTLWVLGIAYVVKYLAFGVRGAEEAVKAIDPSLEEAARISGAGPGRAFVDVVLPLARPALIAAWILAFLPAATELTMSVLLAGPRSQVLGTVLFDLASYADPPSAAVLACVVLALVVAAQVALGRLASGARA